MPVDYEAIRATIHRYTYLVDTGQFERVAPEIFTADARVAFGPEIVEGRDAIAAKFDGFRHGLVGTAHFVTDLIVEGDGDTARSTCKTLAYHWFDGPGKDPHAAADLVMVGGYVDRLVRTPEGWRIRERGGIQFGTGVAAGEVPDALKAFLKSSRAPAPDWP